MPQPNQVISIREEERRSVGRMRGTIGKLGLRADQNYASAAVEWERFDISWIADEPCPRRLSLDATSERNVRACRFYHDAAVSDDHQRSRSRSNKKPKA